MVFGLEICADHAANRIEAIDTARTGRPPERAALAPMNIDVHLLPSAGMRPAYFATRQGGFIFNCDGWNKAPPSGGRAIEVFLDGPRPYTTRNDEGYDHLRVG